MPYVIQISTNACDKTICTIKQILFKLVMPKTNHHKFVLTMQPGEIGKWRTCVDKDLPFRHTQGATCIN